MSIENGIPSNGGIKTVEKIPQPIVSPADMEKWKTSIGNAMGEAAFQYSVTEYEKEQAEKRTSVHSATSSASQFQADAGRVVEEEVIKNLNRPITHAQPEPAGQVSTDAANLEPSKA